MQISNIVPTIVLLDEWFYIRNGNLLLQFEHAVAIIYQNTSRLQLLRLLREISRVVAQMQSQQ